MALPSHGIAGVSGGETCASAAVVHSKNAAKAKAELFMIAS
jgi:L-cystine uptake protein TcyP (sodium:dicarboxylate symporter family)